MKSTVEKFALMILCLIIFGYAYYNFYLNDQMVSINALKKDISLKKQTIRELENEKKTINSKIEQEKNQGSEINTAVTNSFDKKEVIKYFYDLIGEYGLKADKIALTESKRDGYQVGTANFKVSGTYDTVRSFMRQVENDKRKFVIKQLNMGVDGDNYSATMLVEYYALLQKTEKR